MQASSVPSAPPPAPCLRQALLEATGGRAANPSPAAAAASASGGADARGSLDGGRASMEAPRINFEHFLALLQSPSGDLDKFDDRWESSSP